MKGRHEELAANQKKLVLQMQLKLVEERRRALGTREQLREQDEPDEGEKKGIQGQR
jgi:hypothetical protein